MRIAIWEVSSRPSRAPIFPTLNLFLRSSLKLLGVLGTLLASVLLGSAASAPESTSLTRDIVFLSPMSLAVEETPICSMHRWSLSICGLLLMYFFILSLTPLVSSSWLMSSTMRSPWSRPHKSSNSNTLRTFEFATLRILSTTESSAFSGSSSMIFSASLLKVVNVAASILLATSETPASALSLLISSRQLS